MFKMLPFWSALIVITLVKKDPTPLLLLLKTLSLTATLLENYSGMGLEEILLMMLTVL